MSIRGYSAKTETPVSVILEIYGAVKIVKAAFSFRFIFPEYIIHGVKFGDELSVAICGPKSEVCEQYSKQFSMRTNIPLKRDHDLESRLIAKNMVNIN